MPEAALNASEEKVLALKTVQKSNIYNQGKFNVTDSLFNFYVPRTTNCIFLIRRCIELFNVSEKLF